KQPGKLGVHPKLAVFPTAKPLHGANPQRSVPCGKQRGDFVGWKMSIRWRLPGDGPDSIEAEQAKFRAQPNETVRGLCDGVDHSFGKPLTVCPRCVRVLSDAQHWIQREGTRATSE